MTKILFISQYSPETLITGDMVYTWDILRTLKHQKDVYVSFLAYQDKEKWYENETEKLSSLVDEVILVPFKHLKSWQMVFSLYPASMRNRAHGDMKSAMQRKLENESFDIVMFNSLKMAYLSRDFHSSFTACVYVSHNVEAEVSKSIYKSTRNILLKFIYWLDYLKTAWWEKRLIFNFHAITTICSYDADYFLKSEYRGLVQVVRPIVQVTPYESQKPHTGKIIICGSFTWLPKRLNLKKIFASKSIAHLVPNECKLQVVGRTLPQEIKKGNKLPGVHVTGPVDDVNPYYDDAEVAVVPELAGGGFKLKIAEAVKHHLPIVAIKGSITDANMIPGVHYLEATNFDDLLDKAIALVHDRALQHKLTESAVSLFLRTYSIDAVSKDLREGLDIIFIKVPS